MTEADWQRRVLDYAKLRSWRVCHVRAARTKDGWRTAYEGHPGLPDLILARRGVILLVELKSATGRLNEHQKLWLAAAGANGRLWRPADWDQVLADLH